jgi:hypothetical protein
MQAVRRSLLLPMLKIDKSKGKPRCGSVPDALLPFDVSIATPFILMLRPRSGMLQLLSTVSD